MSTNNWWLYTQLKQIAGLALSSGYQPLIHVQFKGWSYRIYTPDPAEYIITVDIVQKVKEMGGNLISFPASWCRASSEAISYGQANGVDVMPHGRLFEILGR